ncbi:MAG: hypothetical protein IPM96_03190 [Ignavibacteria bacterium]|nr:hypothetical protein [Ignavibacteria bacterium]
MKTTNSGLSWQSQSVETYIYSIYFTSQSTGYLAGTNISRTTDSGETWSVVYSNDGMRIRGVYFSSPETGWAVGGEGLIIKSTNSGEHWSAVTSPYIGELLAVHFPSVSTGYIVGNFGTGVILKTTNAGDNWERVPYSPFLNIDPSSVYFFDNNTGWISGNNSTLAKTTDGGFNWQSSIIGTDDYLKSMFFVNAQTGWLVGSEGSILKTTNAGAEPKTLLLKFLIEGFFDPVSSSTIRDTVNVFLREGISPFSKLDSSVSTFDEFGNCIVSFYKADIGVPYYISIEHRNAIETWTANTIMFSDQPSEYDFTVAAFKAYGSNQIQVGNKYCFYSGDLNSDGIIDVTDFQITDNDAYIFSSGYLLSDVTGDNFTDISDLVIINNNSYWNVMVRRP